MTDLGYKDTINKQALRLYPLPEAPTAWQQLEQGKVFVCGRTNERNQEHLTLLQTEEDLQHFKALPATQWYCGLQLPLGATEAP